MDKVLVPEGVALNAVDINAASTSSNLPSYQSSTLQQFQFKTTPAPQMTTIGGAHWEHLPMGSLPPQLDISIPSSFGNAIALAANNTMATVEATRRALKQTTQDVQNSACALNDLIGGLQRAQGFATDFANANNNAQVFVRPIGLQPPGTITSQNAFINAVNTALLENGNISKEAGKVPKILPAEILLNPQAISDALGSGGGLAEDFLQGRSLQLGKFVKVNVGAGLGTLSNDVNFKPISQGGGFSVDSLVFPITSLTQIGTEIVKINSQDTQVAVMEVVLEVNENVAENSKLLTISNASGSNNGLFTITDTKFVSQQNFLRIRYKNPRGTSEKISQGRVSVGGTVAITTNSSFQSSTIQIGEGDAASFPASGTIIHNQQQYTYTTKSILGTNKFTLQGVTPPISYAPNEAIRLQSDSNSLKISATTKIRSALTSSGLLAPNAPKTAPVGVIINALTDAGVISGSKDISIATERLARLNGSTSSRVGGILLVGQAPDIGQLAAKVTVLANLFEFLKPLADELVITASTQLSQNLTKTGIGFDSKNIQLDKLNAANNVGVQDAKALTKKSKSVSSWTMPDLISYANQLPQPGPGNFKAWRSFSIVDLIPGLSFLNKANKQLASSAVASAIGSLYGDLGSLIESGQQELQEGLNNISESVDRISKLSDSINKGNEIVQNGLNFLKNSFGRGAVKLDAHLIGSKLDLLSNNEFLTEVKKALNNVDDPNRPVFGPSPSQTILDTQQGIIAAATNRANPAPVTRLWFGLIIFVVGKGREDLGNQLRTIAEVLSMDTTPIDLPPKTRLKL